MPGSKLLLTALTAVAATSDSSECATITASAGSTDNGTTLCAAAMSNNTISISANQVHKNPRPVELRGMNHPPASGMSESEWHDRLELAALGRILYIYGFGSDLAAQCIMSRLHDEPDTMLMNEWGFFFEETTASSLVKVRFGPGTPPEGVHVLPDGSEVPSKPDVVNIGCGKYRRCEPNERQPLPARLTRRARVGALLEEMYPH